MSTEEKKERCVTSDLSTVPTYLPLGGGEGGGPSEGSLI